MSSSWITIITPSIKTGRLNEVLFSAFDAGGADAVISAAIGDKVVEVRLNHKRVTLDEVRAAAVLAQRAADLQSSIV
jgi:hypothetical protein